MDERDERLLLPLFPTDTPGAATKGELAEIRRSIKNLNEGYEHLRLFVLVIGQRFEALLPLIQKISDKSNITAAKVNELADIVSKKAQEASPSSGTSESSGADYPRVEYKHPGVHVYTGAYDSIDGTMLKAKEAIPEEQRTEGNKIFETIFLDEEKKKPDWSGW